jgi:hypothetical protein
MTLSGCTALAKDEVTMRLMFSTNFKIVNLQNLLLLAGSTPSRVLSIFFQHILILRLEYIYVYGRLQGGYYDRDEID